MENCKEKYLEMFQFLKEIYFETKIDDLGMILGNMQLASDGKSFDPSMFNEWELVFLRKHDSKNDVLHISTFLNNVSTIINSNDLSNLSSCILNNSSYLGNIKSLVIEDWITRFSAGSVSN